MILGPEIKSEIKLHARAEAPKECCGFIIDNVSVRKARNTSQTKESKFKISTEDYIAASNLGEITAVYHSHPTTEARFSEYDKFNSINHNITYILYALKDNSFTQFDPSLSEFNDYIGRSFKIGETDCFALVKDFYEKELNINLNNYHRDENWKSHLEELYDKFIEMEAFREVESLQKYDCILTKNRTSGHSCHIAVYLGGGLMLHQPQGSYSRVEEYSDRHKKVTNKIIRHNELN